MLCARLGSLPVRLVSIGIGPVLLHSRIGEMTLEFRLVPAAGFVAIYPVAKVRSRWMLLFLVGGFIGNVAVIVLLAWLDKFTALPKAIRDYIGPVVFVQLFMIGINLFPFRTKVEGYDSDGLQLWRLFRRLRAGAVDVDAVYAAMLSPYCDGHPPHALATAASSRLIYHLFRPDQWTSDDARRDARDALLRELERGSLRREEELLVLNSLVGDGLIAGDSDSLHQLDEWTREALQRGPHVKPLLVSRGSVLVMLGRFEEGKALLDPVATEAAPDAAVKPPIIVSFDTLLAQTFLARAEHALGAYVAARHWAATAHKTLEALTTTPAQPLLTAMVDRMDTELVGAD